MGSVGCFGQIENIKRQSLYSHEGRQGMEAYGSGQTLHRLRHCQGPLQLVKSHVRAKQQVFPYGSRNRTAEGDVIECDQGFYGRMYF